MISIEQNTIVSVNKLSCLSGSKYLLNNISWTIHEGDQWVVFGRNGCGKTTLLSIIAGYKSFSQGTLKVFGEEYSAENILEIRKRIGWISSSFFDKYYANETVLNIVLSGLFGGLGINCNHVSNQNVVDALNMLDNLGIKNKHKMPFNMLSKGERQHVLIARAFISNPDLLILDEPGTGLDVLARENLLKTIQGFSNYKKMTTVYVTHYPEEILPSFNKCLLLRNGTIFQSGTTKEVFNDVTMSDFLNQSIRVSDNDGRYKFLI